MHINGAVFLRVPHTHRRRSRQTARRAAADTRAPTYFLLEFPAGKHADALPGPASYKQQIWCANFFFPNSHSAAACLQRIKVFRAINFMFLPPPHTHRSRIYSPPLNLKGVGSVCVCGRMRLYAARSPPPYAHHHSVRTFTYKSVFENSI